MPPAPPTPPRLPFTSSSSDPSSSPAAHAPPAARRRVSRRRVLAGSGAGLLVLAGGGTVWRAADQGVFSTGQGPAYAPWSDWRTTTAGPLDLVRAAILAANPHNTQPWRFRVDTTRIDLFADHTRAIGTIDPLLREMHIGLGCALENLLLAAAANGYRATLALLPDAADQTHMARIDLAAGQAGSAEPSPLYLAIPHRHTNRYPYDPSRPVSAETLAALAALNAEPDLVGVRWFSAEPERSHVRDLMIAAAHALVADRQQDGDSAQWYRATWQDLQRHRDGITLDASGLPDWQRVLGKLLPPPALEQQDGYFLSNTEQQAKTAPVLALLLVRDRQDNAQRMRAGRLWQRMHLWATTHGLAMQPLNQMAERADREATTSAPPTFGAALAQLVGDPAWQPLMPFRLGYATQEALLSPRRDVRDVIV